MLFLFRCAVLRAAGRVVRVTARLPDLCVVHEGHPRQHGRSQAGGQSLRLVSQPNAARGWGGVAPGTPLLLPHLQRGNKSAEAADQFVLCNIRK